MDAPEHTGQDRCMNDVVVRALREDEFRAANALFYAALHVKPPTDEQWERVRDVYQPGRVLGAFDDRLIGTARSTDAELVVPGGARVPLAAVTGVGVRADRTRRGVLTSVMRHQLTDFADRGVVAALLYASEGAIYGRFGYGIGTRFRNCTVLRHRARLRPGVPSGGEVELVTSLDEMQRRLPEVYDRLPLRPAMITRGPRWWPGLFSMLRRQDGAVAAVVHHGADGPDGFAVYTVDRNAGDGGTMRVLDLHYADASSYAGLWRYLLSVDLVDEIQAHHRGLDEPVDVLFTDPRACRTTEVLDEGWLRLVDVERALAARSWRGEPLVLEIEDTVLPDNAGRYRVGPDGAERTDAAPDVRLDVAALAMIYTGGWLPSTLVNAGLVTVADPATADRLDELVATPSTPWCGTFF
jgi:predicted acetyltransferase